MAGKEYPLSVVIRAVDRITGPIRQINARMKKLTAPVTRVAAAIGGVGKEAQALAVKLTALAAAAGYGFFRMAKGAIDAGDALDELSDTTGVAVNQIKEYEYVAQRAGVGSEEFQSSLLQLTKRLGDTRAGTGALNAFLKQTSPALLRQVKGAKSTAEAVDLMFAALSRLDDPAKRAALAAAAFGKANLKMANIGKMSAEEIEQLRQRFRQLAGDQEEMAKASARFNDEWDDMQIALAGTKKAGLLPLLPAMQALTGQVTDLLIAYRPVLKAWSTDFAARLPERLRWLREEFARLRDNLAPVTGLASALVERFGLANTVTAALAAVLGFRLLVAVAGLATAFGGLGAALAPVLLSMGRMALLAGAQLFGAFSAFIYAVRAGTGVMYAFNFALWASPIGMVIAAVTALAAAAYLIYKHWEPIKGFFGGLWDGIVASFDAALEKIRAGIAWVTDSFNSVMAMSRQVGQRLRFWETPAQQGAAGPALGAALAAPPAAASRSEATVTVNFENMPRGARVSTDPRSTTDVNTSLGYSMLGGGA